MGIYDSSLTRVGPVFDLLLVSDGSGQTWIPKLLNLPMLSKGDARALPQRCGVLRSAKWNREDGTLCEAKLDPPMELLKYLVLNPPAAIAEGKVSESTRTKREAIRRGDPDVVSEALTLIGTSPLPTKKWYILEGQSQPDAYLEMDDCIVVVEGKRTEPGSTTHTTFMPGRHQMLRHIDCAWSIANGRPVFGFFAVSGGCGPDDVAVPDSWKSAVSETVAPDALETSLPHRSEEERNRIRSCFLGATTWQAICKEFEFDWSTLPETCSGPGG